MTIGARLKRMREERSLTQRRVAHAVDVPIQQISRWENDEQVPGIENCVALAKFYEVTLDELILGVKR